MKKIFLFILIFVLSKVCISQYPVTQYIGADSTLVQSRGGFKGRIVNTPFTDTAQANTQRISQYAGAMVFTTSNNGLWVRNSTATAWNLLASSGSSTNIYNSDGTITGTRVVELSTYPLSFVRNTYKQIAAEDNLTTLGSPNNIRRFTIYDDSVTLTGSDQSASSGDSVLVRTASGRIKTRAQSAIAGSTPTLQQVLATQSNTAIITTATQIDPSTGGLDLTFGDVGTNIWNDIVMTGDGVIGFEAKTITNSKLSGMFAETDSIYLYPHLGQLNIDSLRSWSGISDTTYKKVMTWDTRNGRWEYSNWFGGSGGSAVTTIGTINSQTKSANGAVISGTSLVMQTADATYPGLMTSSDKLRLDSTSYLTIDKTYDSLAWGRNDSTFLIKSLRVQVNGSTVTPTKTDSTVSYNLTSLSLFPTSGTGTATGSVTGELGTNQLVIKSTAYPTGLFNINNSNGLIRIGDYGPDVNNTYIELNDANKTISLLSDKFISINTADSLLLDAVSIRFRTLSNFADTSSWKAVVINNTTGEIRRATYWPGGGGGSGTVNSGTQYRLAYYATTGTAVSEAAAITANRALISDANGVPTHSATTATELGYVSGVTSAIQTQLNTKISGSGTSTQVAYFNGSGSITSSSKFVYNDGSYPSLVLGTTDPLIWFGATSTTYPIIGSSSGLALYAGSTYQIASIYSYLGGSLIAQFKGNSGSYNTIDLNGLVTSNSTTVLSNTRGNFDISRTVPYAASGNNYHGFTDQTDFRLGLESFNSFGSFVKIGNNRTDMGHYASFQAVWAKDSTNQVSDIYDFVSAVSTMTAGTIDSVFRFKVFEMSKSGGTVNAQYGIWIPSLTAATANYGAYIEDAVGIGDTSPEAWLKIKAGTTAAAPLKLTTGTSLSSAQAGALEYTTPQLFFTNGGGIRQEIPQIQQSRVSTQFDATSTTTLANVTGLTASVAAGKIYRFEAKLYTTSNSSGGVKVAIAGTATATAIVYEGLTIDAGLITQSRGTSLGTAVGAVTAVTAGYITISGTITVNAAGTLTVQFAQNASNGTASSVLVGSTFVITEML